MELNGHTLDLAKWRRPLFFRLHASSYFEIHDCEMALERVIDRLQLNFTPRSKIHEDIRVVPFIHLVRGQWLLDIAIAKPRSLTEEEAQVTVQEMWNSENVSIPRQHSQLYAKRQWEKQCSFSVRNGGRNINVRNLNNRSLSLPATVESFFEQEG